MTDVAKNNPVVAYVVTLAKERLNPRRVILFGSRARGDFRETSDYDFAFDLDKRAKEEWSRFSLDVKDYARTLKGIDLVCINDVDKKFRDRILKEGIVLYESKTESHARK